MRLWAWGIAVVLLPCALCFAVDTPPVPGAEDLIDQVNHTCALRGDGAQPFHLQVSFLASGSAEFVGKGTYEEIWLGPRRWKREVHFGEFSSVEAREEDQHRIQSSNVYVPKRVMELVSLLNCQIDPDQKKVKWHFDPQSSSSAWTFTAKGKNDELSSRLIFYHNPQLLGAIVNEEGTKLFSGYRELDGHYIPFNFLMQDAQAHELLKATVESFTLKPSIPESLIANLKDDSGLSLAIPKFSGNPADTNIGSAPKLIRSQDPYFPATKSGKLGRLTVMITLIVDASGEPREPEVVLSASPDFDSAALSAVKKYQFRPAMLRGKPVQTRISVQVVFRRY